MAGAHLVSLVQDLQALDQVAQLADIPGPAVVDETRHRVGGEAQAGAAAGGAEEVLDE